MRSLWKDIRGAVQLYGRHEAPRLAAAMAYYTIFSLAPLLIIMIAVLGLVFGSEEARSQLIEQVQSRIGEGAANQVETMVEQSNRGGSGIIATIIGIVTVLFGASALFFHLQRSLNEIWGVAPEQRSFKHTAKLRLRGVFMIVGLGILLLISFATQAAVNIVVNNFQGLLPGGEWLWFVLNQVVTIGLLTITFAALFRAVPETEVSWRDVWRGAVLTAVIFKLGELAIGFYLGVSAVRSSYGAAGSLVVLLLWIYFSAQILLFGAAFTRAQRLGQEGKKVGG